MDEQSKAPLGARLMRVAWMSIIVGLVIELVLLVVAALAGGLNRISPFVADFVHKVSWSTIVCVGLAVGTAASKAVRPALMGLLGLLAAPVAFTVARTLHKGMAQALDVAASTPTGATLWLVTAVKGLQYACFGAAIAWVQRRSQGNLKGHVAVGAASGVVFGGLLTALTLPAGEAATGYGMTVRAINELMFPVGCSIVLFAADALGSREKTARTSRSGGVAEASGT